MAALPNPVKYNKKPISPFVAARSKKIMQQMNFIRPDRDVQAVID